MIRKGLLCLLAALSVWGCANLAPAPSGPDTVDTAPRLAELIPVIEKLHLNQLEAEGAYKDLRGLAEGYLGQSDSQLNIYQKIYLHIRQANLVCRNQWELLAIVNYIRPEARTDYFSLRVQDLKRAVFETQTALKVLEIYRAFLENPKVGKMVDKAMGKIEAHVYLYEKLMERCRPLARPGSTERWSKGVLEK